ncbi:toxin [Mycolicibacterium peregrinum]|uniref:Toxin n=1 Tax=Mycolicibacterium peregrinum TaxID=43304 RepID=A0A1A0RF03_MYCPR|nr:hypothetical protein [Mycolicibacterium peregrinum]OBB32897.1 toxin [Mycolicibacterium peregrinum]
MITTGDIVPRRDTEHELYVVVLSNAIHVSAHTGRVITCPFIPGQVPKGAMAMAVAVNQPIGTLLPELVQWLPVSAFDEPVGSVSAEELREATAIVNALIA